MGHNPLRSIGHDEKRGWTVKVNGKVVDHVSEVEISHPRFGALNYGSVKGLYDSWCFVEFGGGGVVTIPFVRLGPGIHDVYIGLVDQARINQGGRVLNVPRGFIDPNEKHFEAAQRELQEETGLSDLRSMLFAFDDHQPANPNSTFFITNGENEGVVFHALQLEPTEFVPDYNYEPPELSATAVATVPNCKCYQLRDDTIKPTSKGGELIFGCRFFPLDVAFAVSDMFTKTAAGLILHHVSQSLFI